jgi:hypothetical protein
MDIMVNKKRNNLNKTADLISSITFSLIAIAIMIYSVGLDVPGMINTAPGLLPFVTATILFCLSAYLFYQSIQSLDEIKSSINNLSLFIDNESLRFFILFLIVISYVLSVGLINFELSLNILSFIFLFSSYEFFSITFVTLITKIFWAKSLMRCFIVVLITVETMALIFRYGFGISMPQSF